MAEKTVATNEQNQSLPNREGTRSQERYVTPPVDIYETTAGDPIYREYELVNFFRQFELNEKVDQSKISAELKHGVLTLQLPKAEEAKPRRKRK